MRRGAAEVLACAILELSPGAQLIRGGVKSGRFFYDVAGKEPLPLKRVEKQMRRIVEEERPVKTLEMVRSNAIEFLNHLGQRRLAKELEGLEVEVVQLLEMGEFRDFCPLPHLENAGQVGPFALLNVRPMQGGWRYEGVAYQSEERLKRFLRGRKKGRGAREIGAELGLFSFHFEHRLWHPKGQIVREELVRWWEELQCGAQRVETGNVPHKILFAREQPSLPVGYAEMGDHERVTHFCTAADAPTLVRSHLQAMVQVANILRLESQLSLCGPASLKARRGQGWKVVRNVLDESGLNFFVESEPHPFPGPTLAMQLVDRLGREWEVSQVAIEAPTDGPWVIERGLFGPLDAFVDRLLEHTDGALPLWLAPEQVRLVPLSGDNVLQARKACELLTQRGLRVGVAPSEGTLSARIRRSQLDCVPYVAVVGAKEGEERVRVRKWNQKAVEPLALQEFAERLRLERETRGRVENQQANPRS